MMLGSLHQGNNLLMLKCINGVHMMKIFLIGLIIWSISGPTNQKKPMNSFWSLKDQSSVGFLASFQICLYSLWLFFQQPVQVVVESIVNSSQLIHSVLQHRECPLNIGMSTLIPGVNCFEDIHICLILI